MAAIRTEEDGARRARVEAALEAAEHAGAVRWALDIARRGLTAAGLEPSVREVAMRSMNVAEAWLRGEASIPAVRKAAFAVHAMARECPDAAGKAALRCAGQAVASPHVKGHALAASDYAVRAASICGGGDAAEAERLKQWEALRGR